MARKIQNKPQVGIALALIFVLSLAQAVLRPDQVFVNYSFEDESLSSSTHIFDVYEGGRGSVRQSHRFHYSGYRSLELIDIPGDKDFPELQGHFPVRDRGKLYLRFALLTPTPEQTLNIALAGPQGFSLKKDGIGFWLSTKDGWVMHTTDSIPTKLFQLRGLTWYLFKVIYDLESGTYDMQVSEEGQQAPFIKLTRQWNAAHQPGSKVDKFSFVGDVEEDKSSVIYYVDDILVGVDDSIAMLPSRVPEKKDIQIEGWYDLKEKMGYNPSCPLVFEPEDLGVTRDVKSALVSAQLMPVLKTALVEKKLIVVPAGLDEKTTSVLGAINDWTQGCEALHKKEGAAAEAAFRKALAKSPSAKLFGLSLALSLATQLRWQDVDQSIGEIAKDWVSDPRFDIAMAEMGHLQQNLKVSAGLLVKFSPALLSDLNDVLVQKIWLSTLSGADLLELKKKYPLRWKELLAAPQIAEHYFYVLLWQNQARDAAVFSEKIYSQLFKAIGATGRWGILSGDALMFAKQWQQAIARYLQVLKEPQQVNGQLVLARLASAYAKTNDLANEKLIRARMVAK